jgi:hypothetical protein
MKRLLLAIDWPTALIMLALIGSCAATGWMWSLLLRLLMEAW